MGLENEEAEDQALKEHQWKLDDEPAPSRTDVFQTDVVKIRTDPEESYSSIENTPIWFGLKKSVSSMIQQRQSELSRRMTRKSTVKMKDFHSLGLGKDAPEPEYNCVELPKSKVILSMVQEKINEKIDELRVKKEFELKLLAVEKKNKQQYQDALANKKGAQEVTRVLQGIRGLKDQENILSFLHDKGQGMTFDNAGLPILQKSVKNSNAIIEKINYAVNEDVVITRATGKGKKGKQIVMRSDSMKEDESKFDGRIQGVIENKYGKPSNNMVIQAGVSIIEKDKTIQGPPLELKNRISLKEYKKIVDPKAQQAKQDAQQAELKKMKQRKEYDQNTNEDPYQEFRKFAMIEANRKSIQFEEASTRLSQEKSFIMIKNQQKKGENQSLAVRQNNLTEFNRFIVDVHSQSQRNLKPFNTEYNDSKLNSQRDTNSTIESCYPTTTMNRNKMTLSLTNMHSSGSKDRILIFRNDEERNQSMNELNLMKRVYQRQPPKISDLRPASVTHKGSVKNRQRCLKQ